MILDALLQLSAAQAITVSAVSTNTIDLSQSRDIGTGQDLYAVINVDESVVAAGAATVQFQVISSASANLSSPTILGQTDAIPKTELTLGRNPIVVPIPPTILNAQPIGQRFLGLQYTVGNGPMTAGKFTCYISDSDVSVNKKYPSGFTVA